MTIKTHGRMFTDKSVSMAQINVTDGTDGQALVTDGSGALRFATVGVGGSVGSSTYVEDTFTGNNVLTKFQMTATAAVEESIFVFVDGVAQPTTTFTLSSSGSGIGANGALDEINITPAIATGQQLRVCHLGINTAIADNSITGSKIAMTGDQQGDIMYYSSPDYARLGIGTAGQHLATNAGATAPEWVTPPTTGGVVQMKYDSSNRQYAVNTGNGTIPLDDTSPTIGEGNGPFMQVAITPQSASNILVVNHVGFYGTSTNTNPIVCMFTNDGTCRAVNSHGKHAASGSEGYPHPLQATFVAGGTSAITITIRAGGHGGSQITFNGQGGSRLFGTTPKSSLMVTEYTP
ncbi:uncharacterized protein METZ01_LOCUS191119 [marine metagenome]|uniref:Uncharacterized protein n=1 Tax=marine metagenome TaxID=408172 RepID=A0A382DJ28_9ZZZZ